ncbi:MAG: hypothetical protein SFX73_10810 [Kofleriaceae bacterium]|nr:hypothetical protein [Kofleriaceae bacterium]
MLDRVARVAVVALVAWLAPLRAHAEGEQAVALLPLDAGPKLEIYGQPVASEIARALVAGSIDVVVVGPRMAVPDRARLIVDGNIAAKGEAVVLTVRVRNRADGVLVKTLTSTAAGLANIDKAAADVSAQLLPVVRDRLAELAAPISAQPPKLDAPPPTAPSVAPPAPRPTLLAVVARTPAQETFRAALAQAVVRTLAVRTRTPVDTPYVRLGKRDAAETVKASGHGLGMSFEVLGYEVRGTSVPLARARVRVRVAEPGGVVFDRVVITDTVVGDRGSALDVVAARVAREVLEILRPHFARKVTAW